MKIYELKEEILICEKQIEKWAMENEGDISECPFVDIFDKIELEIEEKSLGLASWYKSILAESKAIKEERTALQKREKSLNNKAERLKSYISSILDPEKKYSDSRTSISWRSSSSVEILVDESELPDKYCNIKRTPSKTEIANAIKRGDEDVQGIARTVKNKNISIK